MKTDATLNNDDDDDEADEFSFSNAIMCGGGCRLDDEIDEHFFWIHNILGGGDDTKRKQSTAQSAVGHCMGGGQAL